MVSPNQLLSTAYALNRDEGKAFWFLGTLMISKASDSSTNKAFGLIEQVLPPGFATPLHVHHGEDEAFYILEGYGTFHCGEVSLEAQPGTFIFFPRDIPHWFHIHQPGQARLLQFNMPAGLEKFFEEAGEPAAALTLPPLAPPNLEPVMRLAPKYHIEILGPPPIH